MDQRVPTAEEIAVSEFGLQYEFAVTVDENGVPTPDTEWSTQTVSAGVGQAAYDLAVLNLYANRRAMEWQPQVRSCILIWTPPIQWHQWPEDQLPPDPNPPTPVEDPTTTEPDPNA